MMGYCRMLGLEEAQTGRSGWRGVSWVWPADADEASGGRPARAGGAGGLGAILSSLQFARPRKFHQTSRQRLLSLERRIAENSLPAERRSCLAGRVFGLFEQHREIEAHQQADGSSDWAGAAGGSGGQQHRSAGCVRADLLGLSTPAPNRVLTAIKSVHVPW